MATLYSRILDLCEEKGVSVFRMCKETGISQGNITDLKMGRSSTLSAKNMKKIADYFGTSVDRLMGKEDLVNNDDELTKYLESLKNRPEMRMLFSLADSATKEDVEKAVKIIEALFEKD